jgi:hypothetical protein
MKSFTSTSITTKLFSIFSIASLTLVSTGARASIVELTCTDKGIFPTLEVCQTAYNSLATNINNSLKDLPDGLQDGTYAGGVANSNAMASAGTGVVYGASYSYGLVGAGLGLGVDLGQGNSLSKVISGDFDIYKFAGFGAQGSAFVGVNPGAFASGTWFGFIEPSRLRVYLSYLSMNRKIRGVGFEFSNYGLVGQYRIMQEKSWGLNVLKWGGVDLSSGFKYSKMKVDYSQNVNQSANSGGQTISFNGPISIFADSSNFSIPIEASTSLRMLYVLNFIGGLGADINLGQTDLGAKFGAEVQGAGSSGTAKAKIGSAKKPTAVNLRGFAGTAFEFAVGSLYANVQKSLTAGVWGVNLGVNLFW